MMMWASNNPSTPVDWITEGDEAHDRIKRWTISKYRDEHKPGGRNETHLTTCDAIEVTFDLYDGYGGGGCEYVILEATLSCAHGVSRKFEYGESGLLVELLTELSSWEDRVREQQLNPSIIVGELSPGADILMMVVVYWNTIDYPNLYVARQHDIGVGKVAVHPSPLKVSPSLEEVRAVVPAGMVAMPPATEDDPNIVEVYI